MEESVRWSLKVSRRTDEALRAYLGHVGGRKGDLSRFIEQAVQAKLAASVSVSRRGKGADADRSGPRQEFADTLGEIRARTRSLSRARFEKLVAEARAHARKRR